MRIEAKTATYDQIRYTKINHEEFTCCRRQNDYITRHLDPYDDDAAGKVSNNQYPSQA